METYHLTSAQDTVTGEYRQVGYMRMEDEVSRMMQFWLWVFITAAAAFVFSFLARNFGKLPESFQIGTSEIVIGVVAFVATLVIHEWMHGLILQRYGARPEFGLFRNKAIATITILGYGLRRNAVILVALTPLVVLTSLALLGIWLTQGTHWVALFALIAIVNAGAAITDLWVIAILLRYPSSAWTVDDKDGMRILMPME
jgi:membrane protein YdbS with pleckstrin-like domain